MRIAKIPSFRVRIALLSALVSGAVLALFGGVTLATMQRIALQGMDEDIREFAHKHLKEPVGTRHWDNLDAALRYFLGSLNENAFILLVADRTGNILHISENWPGDLPPNQFLPDDDWETFPGDSRQSPYVREPAPAPDIPAPRKGVEGKNGRRPGRADQRTFPLRTPEFLTADAPGTRWRVGIMGNPETTIVLGLNMNRLNAETAHARAAFLMALPIALMAVAAGAWWSSRRALHTLHSITRTIERVKAKGLDQRVSVQDIDREFYELIEIFNDMLAWMGRNYQQAIRFSADASHELRTPLTVLQGQLEQAIHAARPGSGEQRRYVTLGNEVQRLKRITEKLLLLSRVDAGELNLLLRPVNLSELLEGVVEDTETLAEQLEIGAEITPDVWVMADPDLLKQVIQNLAANAIKYNQQGGFIRFELRASEDGVALRTENSGRGIACEDRDRVFTRFFRGDPARARDAGSAGLGLSIGREIARAHHGDLVLETSSDSCTAFLFTLPRAATHAPRVKDTP
jgi:two-component system heavy metal sensor histidine kinase CusS